MDNTQTERFTGYSLLQPCKSTRLYQASIFMTDKEFLIIKDQCREICKQVIGWEYEGDKAEEPITAFIYGLPGIRGEEEMIFSFFVRYGYRVWRAYDIIQAIHIIEIIRLHEIKEQVKTNKRKKTYLKNIKSKILKEKKAA